ncbi:MAG: RNA polymerase sigma factor [Alphaproteobacteria bacterium]|nr:RNA polymerase sigma factor [Alphaproteobacteria bacterium]
MRRVQQQDRAAYEQLYQRWAPRLYPFLHRRTGSTQLAEEALQETWLRVYRYRERYDPSRPFTRWLYQVASNAGRDAREPDLESFELAPGPPDEPPWVRDALIRALHLLDGSDRRLFLLVVEGFSVAEAGRMVGVGDSTARTRLKRARARIQEALDVR